MKIEVEHEITFRPITITMQSPGDANLMFFVLEYMMSAIDQEVNALKTLSDVEKEIIKQLHKQLDYLI